jgi:hypothetical protein
LYEAGVTGIDIDELRKAVLDEGDTLFGELTRLELDGKAERLAGGRYVWVGGKR